MWKIRKAGRKKIQQLRYLIPAVLLLCYMMNPQFYAETKKGISKVQQLRSIGMILACLGLFLLLWIPNRLSEQNNRRAGWAWFLISPYCIYFSLYFLNAKKFSIDFWKLNPIAVGFTFWFLYLVLICLLLITGSIRVSVSLCAVCVALLGIANLFVVSFRGMALSAGDLFSIGTAAQVASEYEYKITWPMFAEVFLTIVMLTVSFKIRTFRPLSWKKRGILLAVWLFASGSFFRICCRTSFLEDHEIRTGGFTHQLRYKQYDMLFTTLCTCFYLAAEKPDGYSVQKVKEIAQPYENQEKAFKTPNVIVIMDESFSDLTQVGNGLTLSEDCMPFLHSLTENTIKGNVYTSIYGGNTPNSEYEFLTGNTMAFLPASSIGFHLFVRGSMPSVVSEYQSLGYETIAVHPYRGSNYRRSTVYPQLGFEQFLTRDDFSNPEYLRKYISDQELVKKIISLYENKPEGQPVFSYNVTMQNHGGYLLSSCGNLPRTIEVENEEIQDAQAEIYVNLIRQTDQAIENLIAYFSKAEEPVILILFGDHQPNLGESVEKVLFGKTADERTPEETMEQYKVPFAVWANYDIEEEWIEKTSLNYLYSILAKKLNLPMTGFQSYLSQLSEEIPVLTAGGYWTKDGQFYEISDQESPWYETIREYQILEYNLIFGKKNRELAFFQSEGTSG